MGKNKGSALVWVLVLCLIFAILGISIGWISLSMHQRSVNQSAKQQAYFTARSAIDTVVAYLNADATLAGNEFTTYLDDNVVNTTQKVKLSNIIFDNEMGTCDVLAQNDSSGIITLTANATKGGQTDTMSATVTKKETTVTTTTGGETTGGVNWPKITDSTAEISSSTISSNGKQFKIDSTGKVEGASPQYYQYVVKNNITTSITLNMTQEISDPVFIDVQEGVTLTLAPCTGNIPNNIFIKLEKGAKLVLLGQYNISTNSTDKEAYLKNYPFYIYGPEASVEVQNTTKGNNTYDRITIDGNVKVKTYNSTNINVTERKTNTSFTNPVDATAETTTPVTTTTTTVTKWCVNQYTDDAKLTE